MKKLFFILILPGGLLFGQKSQMIPDFKPQNLPQLGAIYQDKIPSEFFHSENQQMFEDTNKVNLKDIAKAYKKSILLNPELVGRFSHQTMNGSTVYSIGPDNIGCLVPDMNQLERMPGKSLRKSPAYDPMTNACPRIRLIPDRLAR